MLKSKDMIKGAIIEIEKEDDMSVLQDVAYGFGGLGKRPTKLLKGEQYEVVSAGKKGGSSFVLSLKQVNGEKEGEVFLVFVKGKLVSKPEQDAPNNPTDPKLNPNEEFVLVNKNNPSLYYKTINFDAPYYTSDKYDKQDGDIMFSSRIGQRKRIKNMQSLAGVLNTMSGTFSKIEYTSLPDDQQYYLQGYWDAPSWAVSSSKENFDLNNLDILSIRKYNTDTKTVYDENVNYDLKNTVEQIVLKFNVTRYFGEAVSSVFFQLKDDNKLNEKPYLFVSDFLNLSLKSEFAPKEKDIYLDLAIKESGLKKKDLCYYNNNGFTCIAFSTMDELNNFKNYYNSEEKTVQVRNVNDILNHPEISIMLQSKTKMKP